MGDGIKVTKMFVLGLNMTDADFNMHSFVPISQTQPYPYVSSTPTPYTPAPSATYSKYGGYAASSPSPFQTTTAPAHHHVSTNVADQYIAALYLNALLNSNKAQTADHNKPKPTTTTTTMRAPPADNGASSSSSILLAFLPMAEPEKNPSSKKKDTDELKTDLSGLLLRNSSSSSGTVKNNDNVKPQVTVD
jgi:hypothetical protein